MKWYWIELILSVIAVSIVPGYLVWWWMTHG